MKMMKYFTSSKCSDFITRRICSHFASTQSKIAQIESAIQADPGQRGIADFTLPSGELLRAAKSLIRLDQAGRDAAVITGFPCLLDHSPPTETDGPVGAVAIARSFLASTTVAEMHLVTDECNARVVEAALVETGLMDHPRLKFRPFPPLSKWGFEDRDALSAIASRISTVIAIERAGPGQDGGCYTMRGVNMSHLLAPLHELMDHRQKDEILEFETIGIGDGGNEVGMGKVWNAIQTSSIPNPSKVACVVPCDHLIVCGISNWGGTAIAAAVTLLHADRLETTEALEDCWKRGMFTDSNELGILTAMARAGARDGCTGKQEESVDGLPLDEYLNINRQIKLTSLSK